METLVIVAHHRSHYYGSKGKGSNSTRGFRDISCRTFEIGSGLLPNPNHNSFKANGSRVSNRAVSSPTNRTPDAIANSSGKSACEDAKFSKRVVNSSNPIPINLKDVGEMKERRSRNNNMCFSELWAGPAYSNSPPPSSLPIPKFSMKPKRSVSLEFAVNDESDLSLPTMAKSAPCSPTGVSRDWSVDFLSNDDSATKTLRRILNLDVDED